MLEIKDLSVRYGKQAPTIEHFNLNMKKGEIISVVGESGSGKTTVIRAVLGALAGGGKHGICKRCVVSGCRTKRQPQK